MKSKEEFNLSDKRFGFPDTDDKGYVFNSWAYPEEDVKEFIKRLKDTLKYMDKRLEERDFFEEGIYNYLLNRINKLSGGL